MVSWLRGTTWFQRIALVLLLLAVALEVRHFFTGTEDVTLFLIFAMFLTIAVFRKQLLWRVRNRLLLSYFYIGFVPLFILFWLLFLAGQLVLGQFASDRVRDALNARIEALRATAHDLGVASKNGTNIAVFESVRGRTPSLGAVIHNQGRTTALPVDAAINSTPNWMPPEFSGIFAIDQSFYAGANVDGVFAYFPLNKETLAMLVPDVVDIPAAYFESQRTNIGLGSDGGKISIVVDDKKQPVVAANLPEARNSWDVSIATLTPLKILTQSGTKDGFLPSFSRPSLLLADAVTGRMGRVIVAMLVILGGFFILMELLSVLWSFMLTRTITRSVNDLSRGTQYVAAGDFSRQIPVHGQHQLSELATSFNGMTSKIQHYIGEMRKKEKLESEIEIARQVQSRLFPRTVPQLRTLQMVGVCQPGRFVSGDYYDFVKLDDKHTAIALGDVSGKGVSAALLMASIQSSLHTQLRFSGTDQNPSLSTATLMALISQQLYENTPPEKYATFFCSVYDDDTSVLHYTNCGHLLPILIRAGKSDTLPGDGMVVGLLPKVHYDQHEFQLLPGDLVAIFSDGVSEAENAAAKEFGEDRLADLLARNGDKPLEEIIQTVIAAVKAWIHDPEGQDDTTIVLMRRTA